MVLTEINKLGNIQLRRINVNTIIVKKRKKNQNLSKMGLYDDFFLVSTENFNFFEDENTYPGYKT